MTDIARIGFQADTSELQKAGTELRTLKTAALAAAQASDRLASTMEAASASSAKAAFDAARAENSKAQATLDAAKATGTATKAELDAASAQRQHTAAALSAAKAQRDIITAANSAAAAKRKDQLATLALAAALEKQAGAARRAFNASAGMPNGGSGVNPASPNSPANQNNPRQFNVGNIAAQFQDIGVTAAMGMNPLTIALQQGTQLSAVLQTMESPLKGIAAAFQQIINPVSLLSIGLVALAAAGLQFVDWTKVAKSLLNDLADALETAGPYAAALAGALALVYAPAIIAGLQTAVFWIAQTGVAALVSGAQMATAWLIGLGPIAGVVAGIGAVLIAMNVFREKLSSIFGMDLVKIIKDAVNKAIGVMVGFFKGIWNVWKAIIADGGGLGDGKDLGKVFADSMTASMDQDWVGMVADPVIDGLGEAADKVRKFSAGLGQDKKKKKGKTEAERYQDIIDGANRSIDSLRAEQAALGMTAEAASRLRHEQDLLNEANQHDVELTPARLAAMAELAATMASIEEETRNTKDAIDFAKDATKGFISDLRNGLNEGKSLWESFGNAVLNVVNKIQDKLLDMAVDNLFGGGSSGGGMGLFGALGGLLGGLGGLSGSGAMSAQGMTSGGLQYASPLGFAKGAAFTNSVVDSPTMFKFANGNAFGEMGEAGPEAVMPLHRGPDGSLGVRMNGGDQSNAKSEKVENNRYTFNVGTDVNQRDILRLQQMIMATAGPGVVEKRVMDAQRRGRITS